MQNTEILLDSFDKQILDIIQTGFPLEARPYAVIGEKVGISEKDALERVQKLKKARIIRRLGANFDSWKLGFRSTLCAAKVPEADIDRFVAVINAHSGVTHNYLRENAYNIWFTLIAPSDDAIVEILQGFTKETGIAILNLPAKTLYKIKVNFQMLEER